MTEEVVYGRGVGDECQVLRTMTVDFSARQKMLRKEGSNYLCLSESEEHVVVIK